MPTTDQLNLRADARAARKAAREGNVERAQAEAVAQAKLSEEQEASKPSNDPTNVNPAPKPAKKPAATRAQQTAAERRKAEIIAQRDAERSPKPVNVEEGIERWNGMGNPPLHLLNAASESIDRETRDEGKRVAAAAGKGAYEAYVGVAPGGRNRHARMRAQIAAGEMAIAARQKKDENA